MTVANLEPIHEIYERFVGVSHDEILCNFQPLIFDRRYHNIFQGTVHVLDKIISMDIILIFPTHEVDGIGRHVKRFSWADERDLVVECIFLIAHGNAYAAMLPSSEIGF